MVMVIFLRLIALWIKSLARKYSLGTWPQTIVRWICHLMLEPMTSNSDTTYTFLNRPAFAESPRPSSEAEANLPEPEEDLPEPEAHLPEPEAYLPEPVFQRLRQVVASNATRRWLHRPRLCRGVLHNASRLAQTYKHGVHCFGQDHGSCARADEGKRPVHATPLCDRG